MSCSRTVSRAIDWSCSKTWMPWSTETPRLGHHAGTTSTMTLRTCPRSMYLKKRLRIAASAPSVSTFMRAMSHQSWKTASGRTMLLAKVELLPLVLSPTPPLLLELETFYRPWWPQVPSQTSLALSSTTSASCPRPRLKRYTLRDRRGLLARCSRTRERHVRCSSKP